MLTVEYERSWTAAERLYLSDYLKSGARGKASATAASKYTLLEAVVGKGERLVIGDEIEQVPSLDGRPGYRLTDEKDGIARLTSQILPRRVRSSFRVSVRGSCEHLGAKQVNNHYTATGSATVNNCSGTILLKLNSQGARKEEIFLPNIACPTLHLVYRSDGGGCATSAKMTDISPAITTAPSTVQRPVPVPAYLKHPAIQKK
jgi:hypothetical protein